MACIIIVSTCRRELLIRCDAPPSPGVGSAVTICSQHLVFCHHTPLVVVVEVVRGRQIATVTTAPSSCAVHTTRAPAFHLQTDRWYTATTVICSVL